MKDILVSYTRQEKDEATGNYISVNHKGYIQHWDPCPTYTMAIISVSKENSTQSQ